MKKIATLISFLATFTFAFSQVDSVLNIYHSKLVKSVGNSKWNMHKDSISISLNLIDKFQKCSYFNPIRMVPPFYTDTLILEFIFEDNWTISKYDSISKYNLSILSPIIPKYINYYDSIGWGKARRKKIDFLSEPKVSIKFDWNRERYLNKDELKSLNNLIRLPDSIIEKIGIFTETNFAPLYFIKPEKVSAELTNLLTIIDLELMPKKEILRNEGRYINIKTLPNTIYRK